MALGKKNVPADAPTDDAPNADLQAFRRRVAESVLASGRTDLIESLELGDLIETERLASVDMTLTIPVTMTGARADRVELPYFGSFPVTERLTEDERATIKGVLQSAAERHAGAEIVVTTGNVTAVAGNARRGAKQRVKPEAPASE